MSKLLSAIIVRPEPTGEFSIAPVTVFPELDDIASKLGCKTADLRWLQHGPALYIGCGCGQVWTDQWCQEHPITLRGATMILKAQRGNTSFPDNLLDLSLNDVNSLRAHHEYIFGELENGRGSELRHMASSPLVDIEHATAMAVVAELPNLHGVQRAIALGLLASMGIDPATTGQSNIGAQVMLNLGTEIPAVVGKQYPTLADAMLGAAYSWFKGLLAKDMQFSPEQISQHSNFGHGLLEQMRQHVLAQRATYEALGGDFEAFFAGDPSSGEGVDVKSQL